MGAFTIEEGLSFGASKTGENQCLNFKRYEEGFHPCYSQRDGNKGWNYKKEMIKVYIGEERKKMKRITFVLVRSQNQEELRVVCESMIRCYASLIK